MYTSDSTQYDRILALVSRTGTIRPRDLNTLGIARARLHELFREGRVERHGRGLYALPGQNYDQNISLAQACKLVPGGVVCLLSALAFHQIGTSAPHEVWLAVDRRSRKPRISYPKIRFVRFSGLPMTEAVQYHQSDTGIVRVYSPAKSVVDCFRYRNKIGLDVALESLREVLRDKKATVDEIWKMAVKLRQITVIRPYLEAMKA